MTTNDELIARARELSQRGMVLSDERVILYAIAKALEQSETAREETDKEHAEFRCRLLKILKPIGIDNSLLDIELAQIRMQDLAAAEASASQALRDIGELRHQFGVLERRAAQMRPVVDLSAATCQLYRKWNAMLPSADRDMVARDYEHALRTLRNLEFPKGTK